MPQSFLDFFLFMVLPLCLLLDLVLMLDLDLLSVSPPYWELGPEKTGSDDDLLRKAILIVNSSWGLGWNGFTCCCWLSGVFCWGLSWKLSICCCWPGIVCGINCCPELDWIDFKVSWRVSFLETIFLCLFFFLASVVDAKSAVKTSPLWRSFIVLGTERRRCCLWLPIYQR